MSRAAKGSFLSCETRDLQFEILGTFTKYQDTYPRTTYLGHISTSSLVDNQLWVDDYPSVVGPFSPCKEEYYNQGDDGHAAEEAAAHLDPTYCGPCYGAPPPNNAQKAGCCNTCEEVKDAYAQTSWSFGTGEGVEQCEREHYAEKLEEQRHEGCRINGGLRVNKVIGNFHIAPDQSEGR